MVESTLVHLVAGGFAGTVAGIITCPLEVVKTRLQSSIVSLPAAPKSRQLFLIRFVRNIIETEGTKALFKGLAPNLVGVAPSRALYFCAYTKTKDYLNENFASSPDAMPVHAASAMAAGFLSSTVTNPIWFIKTRLQLDQSRDSGTNAFSCAKSIYRESGLRGFYKGITASYFGISETILHFVTYEFIKGKLSQWYSDLDSQTRFVQCMAAGAASKTFASILAYPHGEFIFHSLEFVASIDVFSSLLSTEVARTRLRQEGNKYHSFFQTIFLVWREEGRAGLYRGLATQLIRQIPNTAIMMSTYELIIFIWKQPPPMPSSLSD